MFVLTGLGITPGLLTLRTTRRYLSSRSALQVSVRGLSRQPARSSPDTSLSVCVCVRLRGNSSSSGGFQLLACPSARNAYQLTVPVKAELCRSSGNSVVQYIQSLQSVRILMQRVTPKRTGGGQRGAPRAQDLPPTRGIATRPSRGERPVPRSGSRLVVWWSVAS